MWITLKEITNPRQQRKLDQRWPSVGTVVPTLGQRWANLHCCQRSYWLCPSPRVTSVPSGIAIVICHQVDMARLDCYTELACWLHDCQSTRHRWFSAKLQYLQCISTGDSAVLHQAIDMVLLANVTTRIVTGLSIYRLGIYEMTLNSG